MDGFASEDIWTTLDLVPTEDRTAIRRAYAKRLKITNPEDDAAGFSDLRAAYEAALNYADTHASEAYLSDDEPEKHTPGKAKLDSPQSVRPNLKEPTLGDWERQTAPSPLMLEFAAAFADAQGRLQAALDRSANDTDLLSALDAILSSPVLDRPEGLRAAEAWLTLLIVDHRPRSDLLIPAVIARFDWTVADLERHDLDAEQHSMRQWICRRGRDLTFLRTLQNPDYDYHDAYRILSQPPRRTTLRDLYFPPVSAKQVAEFLNRVRRYQPTVEDDLDPRTVKLWERRLSVPQLSLPNRWIATAGAACLILIVTSWFAVSPKVAAGITLLLALPVLWALVQLALVYVFARPRWSWVQDGRDRAHPLVTYGWCAGLLVLLLMEPLSPSPASAWSITALSIFVVWWVSITGNAHERATEWPWFMRAVFGEFPLGVVGILTVRGSTAGASWQMAVAWLALSFVSTFGQQPLLRLWEQLKFTTQRSGIIVATLICLGAIAFLWLSYADSHLHRWCFAATSIALLLHRVPVMTTERRYALIRRVLLGAGVFAAITMASDTIALPLLGTVILTLAVFNGIIAWLDAK